MDQRTFKIDSAMMSKLKHGLDQSPDWTRELVDALCLPRNLRIIRNFLAVNEPVKIEVSVVDRKDEITDIHPKNEIQLRVHPNANFEFKSPANLTRSEVVALLAKFGGDALRMMFTLLVPHKNEPYHESMSCDVGECSFWFTMETVNDVLKHVVINEKLFRLARYWKKARRMTEYQLWEIDKINSQ